MEKEDYVSLEVAKLLKEKGYNEYCGGLYKDEEFLKISCFNGADMFGGDFYAAPTLYELQKYLREIYNIDVLPVIREESTQKDYCCYIYKDSKLVGCKVAYGEYFYECMNDGLLEGVKRV